MRSCKKCCLVKCTKHPWIIDAYQQSNPYTILHKISPSLSVIYKVFNIFNDDISVFKQNTKPIWHS